MTGASRTVSLRLDLQPDTEPISGCIEHPDGSRRPFWGWLELIAELEDAAAEDDGEHDLAGVSRATEGEET